MKEIKYLFGPIPSRRLGRSLGISPIPKKTCNYSCVFCQLGRTNRMTNKRKDFFPVEDILAEVDICLKNEDILDVITIVGEGEPTLYAGLGKLIQGLKKRTDKPVAVITNGALLYDETVRKDLREADIVLPSLDSYDEESFRKIDRPYGALRFDKVYEGLVRFSEEFKGQILMELMLINGMNDDEASLLKFKELLSKVRCDKIYINTPVRPPAEDNITASSPETIKNASRILGGISIETLAAGGFASDIPDDYKAILSIICRHPMNQHEIDGFLASRENPDPAAIFARLDADDKVDQKKYKGYVTYRLK